MHVRSIAIDLIRQGSVQARRNFDPDSLRELAESIRRCGVLQPVVVRSVAKGHFELLAGERRWRAAQLAGLHELPAVIRDELGDDEAMTLGLIENLQRESLSPMETAEGLKRLLGESRLTHEGLGQRIGKSRVYVTNFLRLLSLEPELKEFVESGALSVGHAKVLAGLSRDRQIALAQQVERKRLSVRALERRLGQDWSSVRPTTQNKSADVERLERILADRLGCPVEVKAGTDGSGSLCLRFSSIDELDGLLVQLGGRPE